MPRGRPPKPTKLHVLDGNPSRKKLNENELEPIALANRPAHLNGVAIKEWERALAAMPPGFYTEADVPLLAIYAQAWQLYRDATITIEREGITDVGSQGQSVAHPAIAIMNKQAEILLKAADRLGMSPTARARLSNPTQKGEDKFSGLLGPNAS